MSNDKLLIPKKLRIGFNERGDTYTSKLGYVIYYDTKGKLRKETSFNNWIDKKIPVIETDNEPTSGFVLNKDVGGGSRRGWDHVRVEKIRIYDPRDFEFEITTANLLYILQECSSIKGKGLEGEFVYAWDGPDLVLLPANSQEYQSSLVHTSYQNKKVSAKSLVSGYTYLNKKQEKLLYIGRFTIRCDEEYSLSNHIGKLRYVFWNIDSLWKDDESPEKCIYCYEFLSGLESIAVQVSETPPENYAKILNHVTSKLSGEIELITPVYMKNEIKQLISENRSYYYDNMLSKIKRYKGCEFYSVDDRIYSIKESAIEVDVAKNEKTGEKLKGFICVCNLDKEYILDNGVISTVPAKEQIILDYEYRFGHYSSNRNSDSDYYLPPDENPYTTKDFSNSYRRLDEGFKRINLKKDFGTIPFEPENMVKLGIKMKNNEKVYHFDK